MGTRWSLRWRQKAIGSIVVTWLVKTQWLDKKSRFENPIKSRLEVPITSSSSGFAWVSPRHFFGFFCIHRCFLRGPVQRDHFENWINFTSGSSSEQSADLSRHSMQLSVDLCRSREGIVAWCLEKPPQETNNHRSGDLSIDFHFGNA